MTRIYQQWRYTQEGYRRWVAARNGVKLEARSEKMLKDMIDEMEELAHA